MPPRAARPPRRETRFRPALAFVAPRSEAGPAAPMAAAAPPPSPRRRVPPSRGRRARGPKRRRRAARCRVRHPAGLAVYTPTAPAASGEHSPAARRRRQSHDDKGIQHVLRTARALERADAAVVRGHEAAEAEAGSHRGGADEAQPSVEQAVRHGGSGGEQCADDRSEDAAVERATDVDGEAGAFTPLRRGGGLWRRRAGWRWRWWYRRRRRWRRVAHG